MTRSGDRQRLRCPFCNKEALEYRTLVPVVYQCGGCRKRLRLVGGRYRSWGDWLVIKARRDKAARENHLPGCSPAEKAACGGGSRSSTVVADGYGVDSAW